MTEILDVFGIDIKLLLAQLLNFGILAFLLTKFLLKPMFRLLDERIAKAQDIEDGAKEISEARSEMADWRASEEKEARAKADAIIKSATVEAEERKQSILASAATEAAANTKKAQRRIEQERTRVFAEAQKELAGVALAAAEKVLGREVTTSDTHRLAEEAIHELQ